MSSSAAVEGTPRRTTKDNWASLAADVQGRVELRPYVTNIRYFQVRFMSYNTRSTHDALYKYAHDNSSYHAASAVVVSYAPSETSPAMCSRHHRIQHAQEVSQMTPPDTIQGPAVRPLQIVIV